MAKKDLSPESAQGSVTPRLGSSAPGKAQGPIEVAGAFREFEASDEDDDELFLDIERSNPSTPLAAPDARSLEAPLRAPSRLEVAVPPRRIELPAETTPNPSYAKLALSLVLSLGAFVAALAGLRRVCPKAPWHILAMMPRAFDGSSQKHSGVAAFAAFVAALFLTYIGVRLRPVSRLMVASSAVMFLVSLAMVTVVLAASPSNPVPPDGARLIPYMVPLALLISGLATALRAVPLGLSHGLGVLLASLMVGAVGGALTFVALQTSPFAATFRAFTLFGL